MYNLLILLAAFLFSSQFLFTEGCQRENGSGVSVSIKLAFYGAILSVPVIFILMIIKNEFFEFSWFSFWIAVIQSVMSIVISYCGIKTFEYANLSVYTVFSMIGGMALPFIYGIATNEEITYIKVVCFILMIISIILMNKTEKSSKKAFIYYIGVFILNGLFGVVATYHQANANAVNSESLMMLGRVITVAMCGVLMIITKDYKVNLKTIGYSAGTATLNSIGNLFLLLALANGVNATVQYPLVTGGTIVFSTMYDLLRRVKISNKQVVGVIIAIASSVLMGFAK